MESAARAPAFLIGSAISDGLDQSSRKGIPTALEIERWLSITEQFEKSDPAEGHRAL